MEKDLMNETGNRSVFKVPEGYFENFGAMMESRLDELETRTLQKKKHRGAKMVRLRPVLYMAAMFVIMFFSAGLVLFHTYSGSESMMAKETTSSEQSVPTAEDYLISSVGTYGISQYYVESQTNE